MHDWKSRIKGGTHLPLVGQPVRHALHDILRVGRDDPLRLALGTALGSVAVVQLLMGCAHIAHVHEQPHPLERRQQLRALVAPYRVGIHRVVYGQGELLIRFLTKGDAHPRRSTHFPIVLARAVGEDESEVVARTHMLVLVRAAAAREEEGAVGAGQDHLLGIVGGLEMVREDVLPAGNALQVRIRVQRGSQSHTVTGARVVGYGKKCGYWLEVSMCKGTGTMAVTVGSGRTHTRRGCPPLAERVYLIILAF